MSSTRHAEPGSAYRQERHASSPALARGLMGNLVAMRCEELADPAEREAILLVQWLSHQAGGLEGAASQLLAIYAGRLGTRSMVKYGGGCAGRVFNAAQMERIRGEFPVSGREIDVFLEMMAEPAGHKESRAARPEGALQDDPPETDGGEGSRNDLEGKQDHGQESRAMPIAGGQRPAGSSADDLLVVCREEAERELPGVLRELCLDPGIRPGELRPWWFHALPECLAEFPGAWMDARRAGRVVTAVGRQVYETLDYALQGPCMVLLDGHVRTGRTFAAKAWCEEHAGRARYVEVPPGGTEISFFRAIAGALGVSINLNSKSHQLRDRIEYILKTNQIMLVFDEAQRLWPECNYRDAIPFRMNWLIQQRNLGVPVGLIGDRRFWDALERIERRTGWTHDQFTKRLGLHETMPEKLTKADLAAVAKQLIPGFGPEAISMLANYASSGEKAIAALEQGICAARKVARDNRRTLPTPDDVQRAIQQLLLASDLNLVAALEAKPKVARGGGARLAPRPVPRPVQAVCIVPAGRLRTGGGEPEMGGRRPLSVTETNPVKDRLLAGEMAVDAGARHEDKDLCLTTV